MLPRDVMARAGRGTRGRVLARASRPAASPNRRRSPQHSNQPWTHTAPATSPASSAAAFHDQPKITAPTRSRIRLVTGEVVLADRPIILELGGEHSAASAVMRVIPCASESKRMGIGLGGPPRRSDGYVPTTPARSGLPELGVAELRGWPARPADGRGPGRRRGWRYRRRARARRLRRCPAARLALRSSSGRERTAARFSPRLMKRPFRPAGTLRWSAWPRSRGAMGHLTFALAGDPG